METNLRLEAIKQAVLLVKDNDSIKNKNKAVFDLADEIIKWIGVEPVLDLGTNPTMTFPYRLYGDPCPCIRPPYEVTCNVGTTDEVPDGLRQHGSVTYKTE